MSSSAIIPPIRAHGWNVYFTTGRGANPDAFAGIYQAPGSDLVTFRHVCDELRLCFEFPSHAVRRESNEGNNSSKDNDADNDPWASSIAFALADHADLPSSSPLYASFVTGDLLDQAVPSLPPSRPKMQNVVKYHIVYHKHCELPSNSPLDAHLQARCAQHLPIPDRRHDPRYLPTDKMPSDPRLTTISLRQRIKASLQSPSKRSVSSSEDVDNSELDSMLVPAGIDVDVNEAKRVIDDFRTACMIRSDCCAISGEGESWYPNQTLGPGVQVCHIVPQQHYHLYPDVDDYYDEEDMPIEESPRRLQKAWRSTWSPRNGILLMKHLREFFDARLVSIHPDTLRVRVFVPYNALTRFNGQIASVSTRVDHEALRYHYEMCCIENMAAESPYLDTTSPSASSIATSGTSTPLSTRHSLPATPSSGGTHIEPIIGRTGDPSKRSRPTRSDKSQTADASVQGDLVEGAGAVLPRDERSPKRRRLEDCQVDDETSSRHDCIQDDRLKRRITANSRATLADRNWAL
ncbi:hypothetical protein GGS24DRAFT_482490 [Hypoxylon argillaceum]|nr:hypothetical protein GGS24DRAFT_482490 [Hypoxylon argillaceum]